MRTVLAVKCWVVGIQKRPTRCGYMFGFVTDEHDDVCAVVRYEDNTSLMLLQQEVREMIKMRINNVAPDRWYVISGNHWWYVIGANKLAAVMARLASHINAEKNATDHKEES